TPPQHLLLHTSTLVHSNAPSPVDITLLSLHDALPISPLDGLPKKASRPRASVSPSWSARPQKRSSSLPAPPRAITSPSRVRLSRSEEHTSELQSLRHLVCRLLLEKKNNRYSNIVGGIM